MNQIKTWQQRQAETGIGSVEAKDDEIRELRQAIEQADVPETDCGNMEPSNNDVICPRCCAQFRAIPVNVQQLMLDAGFEPPFTHPPTAPAQQPLNDFDMRGVLASKLLCWHRLTEAEAQDLVCFFQNVRRTGASL